MSSWWGWRTSRAPPSTAAGSSCSSARRLLPATAGTTGALLTAGGLGVKEKATFGGDVTTEGAVIATGSEATPASATATCVKGQLQWDANYVYMCTASNTWKRSALSTWA